MERDANEWRAIELDRLQELQKEAWDEGDRDLVLRCMKRRASLLGLDAPEKLEHSGGDFTVNILPPNEGE
jgi:hypothetical protein